MAEKVTIDIPGIGKVEAENAASEATLKKLLDAITKNQKANAKAGASGGSRAGDGTSGGGGAGGGGAGGGGGGKGGGAGGGAGPQAAAASKSAKALNALGAAGAGAGYALGTAAKATKAAGGALVGLGEKTTQLIGKFAAVGDDLTKAADIFSGIPIIGSMFSAVASAVESTISAYSAASQGGASFGGSLNAFSNAASSAGMSMQDFGNLIRQNGQGLLAFGATTESGAQNFAKVSRQLRATGSDLYALGFSTKDINAGLASYGSLLRLQGGQGKQSSEQMVKGAKTYLKELDLMAKVTGEERSAKEAQMKALAIDAQFIGSMAGKSQEARQSFLTTVGKIPGPLQGFVKDFLATGTLTTDETQRIGALMGGDVMKELQNMRNKLQSGAVLSAEEQDRLATIMKKAGQKTLESSGSALAGSSEMATATQAVASAAQINEKAITNGTKEQKKAAEETDKMNEEVNRAKASLAEFSNRFSMVLVNSGLIGTLLAAFEFTANFVLQYVVPMFHVLVASVSAIVGSFLTSFGPALNSAGGFFNGVLIPAIQAFTNFLVVDLIPAVAKTFNDLKPVLIFLAGAVMTVAKFITDNLTAVLVTVGIGLLAYYTILAAVTVLNFLEAASKSALVIATGTAIVSMYGFISTMAGMIAGMVRTAAVYAAQHIATGAIILAKGLMVAAAFLIAIWPITLFVAAIGATIYIFKKFGGDLSVVKDGLLIMWEGYKMFLNYFKLGLLKVLDYFLDMGDAIEQTEKDIAANKQEAVDRANNIQNTMDKNRKLAQEEQLAEEKREREEAERNRKLEEQRNQKPPAPPPMPAAPGGANGAGSGMGGGMGGGGAAVTGDTSSAAAVPGLDYNNQGGDDFLKAFAAREGSSFVPPPPAQPKTPTPAQPVTPTTPAGAQQAQAGAARTQLEADAAKAAQEKQAAAAAAAAKPPPEKPPQDSAAAQLAELNNKMATLIKYTYTVAHNTNENVTATRGLNKDLYKA
jgi:hypothetical protein